MSHLQARELTTSNSLSLVVFFPLAKSARHENRRTSGEFTVQLSRSWHHTLDSFSGPNRFLHHQQKPRHWHTYSHESPSS